MSRRAASFLLSSFRSSRLELDRCCSIREVWPFLEAALREGTSRFVVFCGLNCLVLFDKKSHPHLELVTPE